MEILQESAWEGKAERSSRAVFSWREMLVRHTAFEVFIPEIGLAISLARISSYRATMERQNMTSVDPGVMPDAT